MYPLNMHISIFLYIKYFILFRTKGDTLIRKRKSICCAHVPLGLLSHCVAKLFLNWSLINNKTIVFGFRSKVISLQSGNLKFVKKFTSLLL